MVLSGALSYFVMPGLDPGIHAELAYILH